MFKPKYLIFRLTFYRVVKLNNWKLKQNKEIDEKRIIEIQKKYGVQRLVAKFLASKDFDEEEERIFLNPTRDDFHDPFLMPDMDKAVKRIIEAINNNEKITIFGDYDADGITSTTILKRFFKDRGIDVGTYIPNRLNEGYGMNVDAIKKIVEDGTKLIITVDTGITAVEEVKYAKELGIDVVVTDHHEQAEEIPDAVAVVDLKRNDSKKYPFRDLCGAGVAFKLCLALCDKMNIKEDEALKYIVFAAIGTIADVMPLIDENRIIVKFGLLLLIRSKYVGINELIRLAGLKNINTEAVAFGIAPRLNACGRMGKQEDALELFTTDDPIKAREIAAKVESYNRERQAIEADIYDEVEKNIEKEKNDAKCIVQYGDKWHHGVIGIVSSKITEKYNRPSILLGIEDGVAKGSGRSIEGFDLHEALMKNNEYIDKFGGHSMAIGLSLTEDNLESFKKQIEQYANKVITDEMLIKNILIDEEVEKNDLSISSIKEISMLEPFGEENEKPVFLYKNLKIVSIRSLSEGKHLKLLLQDGDFNIDVIGFGLGYLTSQYSLGEKVDIVGNLDINSFNGRETIQMILKDMRKSIGNIK